MKSAGLGRCCTICLTRTRSHSNGLGNRPRRVNAKLYAALFPDARPVVAYLELEEIARELLTAILPARFGIAQGAVYAGPARGAFTASGGPCAAVGAPA